MAFKTFHLRAYFAILAAILCWTKFTLANGKQVLLNCKRTLYIYTANLFLYLIL